MNRLNKRLALLQEQKKKALATYVVNGDPNPQISLKVLHTLVDGGADILEIGVPFSDPMAEGPVIQRGHERALEYGVSLRDCCELIREFRKTNTETPVILMGYANPVERMGYQTLADLAKDTGVDGFLTVDLPPEEASDFHQCLKHNDIESIFLLAPTSSDTRVESVAQLAGGFIYYVSLKGVTGAGHLNVAEVQEKIAHIRDASTLPILVGFGIKDGASAQAVAEIADGVVVGSALVDILGSEDEEPRLLARLKEKVVEIRQALDE